MSEPPVPQGLPGDEEMEGQRVNNCWSLFERSSRPTSHTSPATDTLEGQPTGGQVDRQKPGEGSLGAGRC